MSDKRDFLKAKVYVAMSVNSLQATLMKFFSQYSQGLITRAEFENSVKSYLHSTSIDIHCVIRDIKL